MLRSAANKLDHVDSTIPLAYVNCGVGFLGMYVVEQFTEYFLHRRHSKRLESLSSNPASSSTPLLHDNSLRQLDSELKRFKNTAKGQIISLALLLGIGIHAFFEGLAVGLQEDVHDIITTSLAIVFHKAFEGLVVGTCLLSIHSLSLSSSVALLVSFILMTPSGIFFGALLSSISSPSLVTFKGICLSLSSGTFIYLAIVELNGHTHSLVDEEDLVSSHGTPKSIQPPTHYPTDACFDHVHTLGSLGMNVALQCDSHSHSDSVPHSHIHPSCATHAGGHPISKIVGSILGFCMFIFVQSF
eukprot:Sdes_comp19579_c0_seq2m11276